MLCMRAGGSRAGLRGAVPAGDPDARTAVSQSRPAGGAAADCRRRAVKWRTFWSMAAIASDATRFRTRRRQGTSRSLDALAVRGQPEDPRGSGHVGLLRDGGGSFARRHRSSASGWRSRQVIDARNRAAGGAGADWGLRRRVLLGLPAAANQRLTQVVVMRSRAEGEAMSLHERSAAPDCRPSPGCDLVSRLKDERLNFPQTGELHVFIPDHSPDHGRAPDGRRLQVRHQPSRIAGAGGGVVARVQTRPPRPLARWWSTRSAISSTSGGRWTGSIRTPTRHRRYRTIMPVS